MTASSANRRKVVILGLRGIPDVQGGVETHVAALAARMVRRGWDVEVLGRSGYLPPGGPRIWNGVTVTPLWAPRSRRLEALVHTFFGLLVAARRRPDVVHIHAIGPALLTPLARLLGLRVVVTHHGFDYERQKWGALAKGVLRLGERVGMGYAHARIAVSRPIADAMNRRWNADACFIPNGIEIARPKDGTSYLGEFALAPGRYVLTVARIVEEKRQLDLIAAFARLADPGIKLVIVGGAEFGGEYLRAVEAAAKNSPGVVMTGFRSGEVLAQLFAHASLFVLPSSHEGMPIALLEALGHGLPVLASDIAANLALDLDATDYFPLGDITALADAMRTKLAAPQAGEESRDRAQRLEASLGWDGIADRTAAVYETVLPTGPESIQSPPEHCTAGRSRVRGKIPGGSGTRWLPDTDR